MLSHPAQHFKALCLSRAYVIKPKHLNATASKTLLLIIKILHVL